MASPLLAARGKDEQSLFLGEWRPNSGIGRRWTKACRAMEFSNDGRLFVYCDSERTVVLDTKTLEEIKVLDIRKACGFSFSPDDKILCTFEPFFTSKDNPEGKKNLVLWDTSTWESVIAFVQKKQTSWSPVWSGDSTIVARLMTNNVFFHTDNNFEQVSTKLHIDKLESFSMSNTKTPPHRIACFVRGAKGAPSSVKIYNYPDFDREQVVASKSFFKADTVVITWNARGNAILVRAATEVDTTGASYYGEQSLHYMNCSGDTSIVQLPKNGPIYDVAWDPDSTKFCVTYGFMPAKASIFNHKCNIVHDFGPSPKNMCTYNPQGNLLILAGFGNLRGNVEIWHNEDKAVKQIAQLEAPDTTHLDWCADGEHFVTATTTPRLRVNNGYKIWHYAKTQPVASRSYPGELHEVKWQNVPSGTFGPPRITAGTISPTKAAAASKPQSYVPPHARGRSDYSAAKFKMDDEEVAAAEQNLSKSALKNKKKREAKKKKEQQQTQMPNMSQGQRDAVAMAQYLLKGNNGAPKNGAVVSTDTEKKIKNLKKKIQTIEKLKTQQKEGKQLEKNQLEKIATENDLIAQLKELEMSG